MISDRDHVKMFIGSFGDELFGCVSDAVKGIFSCVKMKVSLKGLGLLVLRIDSFTITSFQEEYYNKINYL